MSALFTRVVEASGLSPIFATEALRGALEKAGLKPETLTPADLPRAAEALERVLRIFLAGEAPNAVARILALKDAP